MTLPLEAEKTGCCKKCVGARASKALGGRKPCMNDYCKCHSPKRSTPYNQRDHSHCWQSENPPCGLKGKHACCLCELHPTTQPSTAWEKRVKELVSFFLPMERDALESDISSIVNDAILASNRELLLEVVALTDKSVESGNAVDLPDIHDLAQAHGIDLTSNEKGV